MFVKILFTVLLILCTVTGVILVHFLPVENKSLKWNLNARCYCYYIPLIIDFVILCISLHLFGQDGETSDKYFAYEIGALIGIFLAVFISDRYAVNKRIKPYISKHPQEYKEYDEQNVGRGRFDEGILDSLFASLLLSMALWCYYMTFWGIEPY
ncbi:MAG: hypothetical protein ACI4SB_01400 [Acutalibacteraceae bacterium]